MLALWSCGRRGSVVQAQRQIHRALAGSCAATYARRHPRHADRPLALPRKIGATGLFIYSASSLSLGVAQLSCVRLALASLALFEPIAHATLPISICQTRTTIFRLSSVKLFLKAAFTAPKPLPSLRRRGRGFQTSLRDRSFDRDGRASPLSFVSARPPRRQLVLDRRLAHSERDNDVAQNAQSDDPGLATIRKSGECRLRRRTRS
jgi:hypothetical protein